MKKILPLIAITMACASCKSPEQKLKERMEPVLKDLVLHSESITQVDSIHIYKIDTLTDIQLSKRKAKIYVMKLDSFQTMAGKLYEKAKLINAQSNRKKAEVLAYGMTPSMRQVVVQNISEITQIAKDIEQMHTESMMDLDSVKYYSKKSDALVDQIQAGKVDNKTFRGYVARFSYKGSDKNNVLVKKDSVYAFLTPNLHIIPLSAM